MQKTFILAVVLFLTGCAALVGNQYDLTPEQEAQLTVEQRLFAASQQYEALQEQAITYLQLPTCGVIVIQCKDKPVALAIQKANKVASTLITETGTFAITHEAGEAHVEAVEAAIALLATQLANGGL